MSQPPNPPTGGSPQQPGGEWPPPPGGTGDWQSDPTHHLPTPPQYPPTQPMPAQQPGEQWPGESWSAQSPQGQPWPGQPAPTQPLPAQEQPYGQNPYGQPPYGPGSGQNGPGGYGPSGQYGAAGAYGTGAPGAGTGGPGYGPPGQYGPPGGNFGAPPSGGFGAPPPGGGRGRNPVPMILGIVAVVVVIGLVGWFFFLRPTGTATPSPSAPAPTRSSVDPTPPILGPSSAPSTEPPSSTGPSLQPSSSAAAQCSAELTKLQCEWAVYLRSYVQIDTCRPDSSDISRQAFLCTANARGKLHGEATVALRSAVDSKDLTELMDDFFRRAGIPKGEIGSNWKKPPAHTNWWYTDTPKKIEGKLGSAAAKDGTGRVAWTFSKQRFFIEAVSDGDTAKTMIDWWAHT